MSMMGAGCVSEIIGYGGRVMLWENPFGFAGFLIQISKFNDPVRVGKGGRREGVGVG